MRSVLTSQETLKYLVAADPKLQRLFDEVDPAGFEMSSKSVYCALVGAVVGQKIRFTKARQLRGKIYAKLGGTDFGPEATAAVPDKEWRELGLETRQLDILRRVETWCTEHPEWCDTNEGLAQLQKSVHGIGPWTIQVVKLTALTDLDIFPENDVFLNERLKRLYELDSRPSGYEIKRLTEKWKPYRSIVCWWLWRWQIQ